MTYDLNLEAIPVLSIGKVERRYLDSLYALNGLKTSSKKLQFLRNRLGSSYFHCTSCRPLTFSERKVAELQALELILIDEERLKK